MPRPPRSAAARLRRRSFASLLLLLSLVAACVTSRCPAPPRATAAAAAPPDRVSTPVTPTPPPPSASSVDSVPPFDAIVAEATATHHPVLLDFAATGCKPCAALAAVLETPEVATALSPYRVQKYAIDDGAQGRAAADRFEVRSVPTLIVLSADGAEIDRSHASDAPSVRSFLEERAAIAAGGALTEERMKRETDPLTLVLGAHAAERDHAPARAEALLRTAKAADPQDARGLASVAEFELLHFKARHEQLRAHAIILLDYARRHPDGTHAFEAIGGLAALPPEDRPEPAQMLPVVLAVYRAGVKRGDWTVGYFGQLFAVLELPTWSLLQKDRAPPEHSLTFQDPLVTSP